MTMHQEQPSVFSFELDREYTRDILDIVFDADSTLAPQENAREAASQAGELSDDTYFEPIFRFDGSSLIQLGCRAFGYSEFRAADVGGYLDKVTAEGPISMIDAVSLGYDHLEMVERNLSVFAQHYTKGERLYVEVDIFDLESKQEKLPRVIALLKAAASTGIAPQDIVVEMSASNALDIGVTYTIVNAVRECGVQVSLVDIDVASFNPQRIFLVRPDSVKFDNSWIGPGTDSVAFTSYVSSLITVLDQTGIRAGLTGISNQTGLDFALACKFFSVCGPYLAKPILAGRNVSSN